MHSLPEVTRVSAMPTMPSCTRMPKQKVIVVYFTTEDTEVTEELFRTLISTNYH